MKKIIITSQSGHFGKVLGYDDRYTYPVPTVSTIIGMLQVLYGENMDNFKFGYLFESDLIFKDDIIIHKKGTKIKGDVTDIRSIELHYNCKLIIYTDIESELNLNYILCMGKAGNIARLHFPIREITLQNKGGQGFNQFTTKDIGEGRIESINLKSEYNKYLDSYDHQVEQLRFNRAFGYDKNFDEEEGQNIFMWQMINGKVGACND